MYVVAFNGSARKDGNTAILLQTVLEELEKEGIGTELVQFAGQQPEGCRVCNICQKNLDKRCALDSDIVNEGIAKMIRADGILVGSPVYFGDLTAGTKGFIERAGRVARANGDMFKRKVGAAVVAVRRAGGMHTFDSINHFFTITQMIIPGANYWNIGIGREAGEARGDAEGIEIMRVLGRNMSWVMKKLAEL
jgi:multimeric flavodoxin WrbA